MQQLKVYPTIAVCGLDCGLCPRYYTVGTSRCPGCGGPAFLDKHPSCSFITCCVKRRGLEVCGQCPEFPCSKFKNEEEYRQAESSSYPPARRMLSNLAYIRGHGLEAFLRQQQERMALLGTMLGGYDEGRSRSFFCRAAALLEPAVVKRALSQAKKAMGAGAASSARADKARALRGILVETAINQGIDLRSQK